MQKVYKTTLLTPWIRNNVRLAAGTVVSDVSESEKNIFEQKLKRKETFEEVVPAPTPSPSPTPVAAEEPKEKKAKA